MSVRLSVCHMEQFGSQSAVVHEIWYLRIFRKSVEIIKVLLKSYKNNWHFTWRPIYIFFIIFRSILLGIKNISDEICRENKKIIFNNFFRKSCSLWDNVEKCGSVREAADSSVMWLMRIAFWLPKSTNTHSEYVIVSIAFPLYQRLHERASMLH